MATPVRQVTADGKGLDTHETDLYGLGQLVYTRPRREALIATQPLVNPIYGIGMNQNLEFGGTPDLVHDGIDSTNWTASALSGTWTFSSSTHAYQAVSTVVDYTLLTGDTLTLTGSWASSPDTLTEGIEWAAATSNTATATSLASAIDGIAGLSAASSGAVVTIICDSGIDITAVTSSDGTNLPSTGQSVDATATTGGNQALFTRSSSINPGGYVAITGWIYLTGWSTSGTKDVTLQFRLAGVSDGDEVSIGDVINTGQLNTWQRFNLELTDFSLTGNVDEIVITTIDVGGGPPPDYYLDFMNIQNSAGTAIFSYQPPADEIYHIISFATVWVDNYTAALEWDQFLSVPELTNGLDVRLILGGELTAGLPLKNLFEWTQFPQVKPIEYTPGATQSMLKTTAEFEISLDGRTQDRFTVRVQDDLSTYTRMHIYLVGKTEKVIPNGQNS